MYGTGKSDVVTGRSVLGVTGNSVLGVTGIIAYDDILSYYYDGIKIDFFFTYFSFSSFTASENEKANGPYF